MVLKNDAGVNRRYTSALAHTMVNAIAGRLVGSAWGSWGMAPLRGQSLKKEENADAAERTVTGS